ncbi:Iron-sulfur cluster repair protein DnrN [Madurella mycetomatis]|uniref:Iron-sulfur cluster repair protein DnrN n=1 Tax=Madurella mycetomatis TaxID=100816 RepID=A0A175W0D5_9PEZI|nr:Iron-sulfur cluster repair protein DnrN [Madurella mycetomatis]KXX78998.1 Iron-sulfur cluster repair protein DnrN [Madurella mycetomatis]
MSSTTPPTYSDTPLALIPTPKFETGKDDPFTIEASHMALSHNAFIRGFNSIYQQAPRIHQPADKADFVGCCLAWVDCVATHHQYEETELFPNIDKTAGKKGLMDSAVHEHEAFQGGLERFKKYLLDKGPDFSSTELVALMDDFKEALHSHLKSEPPAILALAKYNTPDTPIDILGIADAAGKKQVTLGFMFNTLPVFFLNMETVEFEGGMWHGVFPPLKGVARFIMNEAVPMGHSGRWRFTSCSADGRVKCLAV